MMNKTDAILITGANGFVGKNLTQHLLRSGYENLLLFDKDTDAALLAPYTQKAAFVFHLAGVNRPQNPQEFYDGNRDFTQHLLYLLQQNGNKAPILFTSSIQAQLENDYGKSKREAEDILFQHERDNTSPVLVYRLPNVFGKWCKPSYNSVVATFCHNIANDLPIEIRDPAYEVELVYIDDVVQRFILAMEQGAIRDMSIPGFCHLMFEPYLVTLGKIAELIQGFKASRGTLDAPDVGTPFTKKLHATYLSYLPTNGFSYPLTMNCDARGSFTEFLRTPERGQVSVNISNPGIVKGNHWHHTKNEKFLVVKGHGIIRFRKVGETEIFEYPVSGEKLEVVDIPTGYTHNIENIGKEEMVTVMWANEPFDPEHPDTYYETV